MEHWREQQSPLFGKAEWREVGKEIYRRRKQKKWTQEDLAGFMDSDHRVVSRHENGESMSVETLVKYAVTFGCSTESLLPENLRKQDLSGITPPLRDTLRLIASLPETDQMAINTILLGALDLAKRASYERIDLNARAGSWK